MIGLCTRLLAGVLAAAALLAATPIEQSAPAARIFVTGAGISEPQVPLAQEIIRECGYFRSYLGR